MSGNQSHTPDPLLGVWVTILALVAVFVGGSAGVLAWIDSLDVPRAIMTGFAAFGGSFTLALLLLSTLKKR